MDGISGLDLLYWFAVFVFSSWGGAVKYIMEENDIDICKIFSQILVSSFTGVLTALYVDDNGYDRLMIIICAGVAGTLGQYVVTMAWDKFKK